MIVLESAWVGVQDLHASPVSHDSHAALPQVHLGAHLQGANSSAQTASNADNGSSGGHEQGQVQRNFLRRVQASSSIVMSTTLLTLLHEEDEWMSTARDGSAYIYPLLLSTVIAAVILVLFRQTLMTQVYVFTAVLVAIRSFMELLMLDSKNMRSVTSLTLAFATIFAVLLLLEAAIDLGGKGDSLYQSSITARIMYGALSRITASISTDRAFFGTVSVVLFSLLAVAPGGIERHAGKFGLDTLRETGSRGVTMLAFQFFLEAVIPMTTYGNAGEDVLWACLVVAVVGILSNIRRMQTIALFCSWAVPGTVTMYLRNSGMPDSTIFAISAILFFGVYVLDWLLLQAAVGDGVPETAVMTAINFFGSMAAVQLTRSLQSTDSVQTFLIIIVLLYCTALMLDQGSRLPTLRDPLFTVHIHEPAKLGLLSAPDSLSRIESTLRAQIPREARSREVVLPHAVFSALASVLASADYVAATSRKRNVGKGLQQQAAPGGTRPSNSSWSMAEKSQLYDLVLEQNLTVREAAAVLERPVRTCYKYLRAQDSLREPPHLNQRGLGSALEGSGTAQTDVLDLASPEPGARGRASWASLVSSPASRASSDGALSRKGSPRKSASAAQLTIEIPETGACGDPGSPSYEPPAAPRLLTGAPVPWADSPKALSD